MCGITGWLSFDRDLTTEANAQTLQAMTETMACRGPDAAGTWTSPHMGIGHRRLAVIDLIGGVQPMHADADGQPVVLTYSGEAYNFTELRTQLRSHGHTFSTNSDTEVVLRGYLQWGDKVAERLNGMYAFAIWDTRRQALTLIRDRLGVKPLYYYPTGDGVLFGSEPKAILANPLAHPVVDADGLRRLFTPLVRTPGQTPWGGMYEVPPGTCLTIDRHGLRTRTYWQLSAAPHSDDLDHTVGTVRELLTDIVRRQLVADVPLCVLLSGGLDSSAITTLAARQLADNGGRITTFAVDFVDQAENFSPEVGTPSLDAPFVHDVAEHAGTEHHDIILDHNSLADPDLRVACIRARDLPCGFGDRDLSVYRLFEAVREHSTVALSGESGDEVFAGYPSFHLESALNSPTFPWMAVIPLDPAGMLAPELSADLKLDQYLRDEYADACAAAPTLDQESANERRMRRVCYLHLTRELPALLDRKDRISMAVGLETRVPYCDHRLVDYVFNAPWSAKTFDGMEKSLLRAAVADLLPQSVKSRQKSGYPATRDHRYVQSIQQQAAELARRSHPALPLFDVQQLATATQVPPGQLNQRQRSGIEQLLDTATWFDLYNPSIQS